MVLGYDQQRPIEKNYKDFVDGFAKGLEKIGNNKLSWMIYGSYVRKDYEPGRSDIDSVLTFPYDVVIPKDFLNEVSKALYKALKDNNIPFQVTTLDTTTLKDGRFNSFTQDFYDYFETERKIVFGPDYLNEMVCLETKTGEESTLSHNLRKIRNSLLFAEYNKNEDRIVFVDHFNKTLNAVSRGSKQVLNLVDGEVRKNRFSALKEIPKQFPSINAEPLEKIKYLFQNLEKLDKLYKDTDELMKTWNSSVTFFEEVIREYIRKHPISK